jgi:thioredoxin 1
MSENIINITDSSFEAEVLKADIPVLVDFWAEWCGPCKIMAPILESIVAEYSGKLKIAKLNVDDNHQTSTDYNIRGIPTLILFKKGTTVATTVGALSKAQLTKFLNENI